ncbi:MAG: CocE/NonD family hydrolase [Anaerolineae bacterium]|nr:CocE/NonD family hydrolase [Anaerolineae bacterium]
MSVSQSEFGINISKDVMIPMRDGVRLAADIYRPAREGEIVPGKYPTILIRTSYDKAAARYVDTIANFFTPRGYVTVQQDLRGRYNSEGRGQYFHVANVHEGEDGYDTIEWIAAQSWSNGKIGMVGSSHPGLIQLAAALQRPPHLTAIWPDVAPTNPYEHEMRWGGAMQLHMFGALFLHAQDSQAAREDPAIYNVIYEAMKGMRELVYATPFKPGHTPLRVVPELEQTLFNYYYRGAYDEFWSAEYMDYTAYYDRIADIPGTFSGGWWDPFSIATTKHFAAMTKQNKTPQRMIIGPWTHMGMRGVNMSFAGDADFGPAAVWGFERYNAERLRFFDRWLKGIENEIEKDAPIKMFVMGGGDGTRNAAGRINHGGAWRDEFEWPLARAQSINYYMRADNSLSTEPPTESADTCIRFTYDPAHPVPTISGPVVGYFEIVPLNQPLDPFWRKYLPPWAIQRQIVQDGPKHQKEEPGIVGCKPPFMTLDMRPDNVVFQTAPLAQDVEVTGPLLVRLWISSSAVDTDFTAKLLDIYPPSPDYPDGYHMNLADGILRCRYRDGFEREKMMTPGEIYPVEILLPPTSNLFQKGHSIRLDISSSNFPRFDLNPNTGEPMGRHTRTEVAHNAVYCDAAHPSHIVLPIIPSA